MVGVLGLEMGWAIRRVWLEGDLDACRRCVGEVLGRGWEGVSDAWLRTKVSELEAESA